MIKVIVRQKAARETKTFQKTTKAFAAPPGGRARNKESSQYKGRFFFGGIRGINVKD
jgi:hypothetical protein